MIKLQLTPAGQFFGTWTSSDGTLSATGATGSTRRKAIGAILDAANDVLVANGQRRLWLQDEQVCGPDPVVGMGAFKTSGSDRYSYTVTAVLSPTRIELAADRARGNGDGKLLHEPGVGEKIIASLRKDGEWREVGQHPRLLSRFVLGERDSYYDPSR